MQWVLLAFFISACGNERSYSPNLEQKRAGIIQGELCQSDQFPASIELLVDAWVEVPGVGMKRVRAPLCGGTLIEPDLILTAAHCLSETHISGGFGQVARMRIAVVDQSGAEVFEQTRRFPPSVPFAKRWKTHELFQPDSRSSEGMREIHDIALMRLDRPMSQAPVKLLGSHERNYLTSGMEVQIVGWGAQGESDSEGSRKLQKMCAITQIGEVKSAEFQIGAARRPRKCFGDSGGASYIRLADGQLRLVGLTSRSYDRQECQGSSIDTRVDAYWDWIEINRSVL